VYDRQLVYSVSLHTAFMLHVRSNDESNLLKLSLIHPFSAIHRGDNPSKEILHFPHLHAGSTL
jgi:hypothetical protein